MNRYCHSVYTSRGFMSLAAKKESAETRDIILVGYPDYAKQKIFSEYIENNKTCRVFRDFSSGIFRISDDKNNLSISDGTYPYSFSYRLCGAGSGIIDMGKYCRDISGRRDEIFSLFSEINRETARCTRFLSSAAGVSRNSKSIQRSFADTGKISRFCSRTWKKKGIFPSGRIGREEKAFSFYINTDGVVDSCPVPPENCDELIVIRDKYGFFADCIIDKLRRYALSCGLDVMSYINILFPDEEPWAIFIPEIKTGIIREKDGKEDYGLKVRRIYSSRFFTRDEADTNPLRLSFNSKALDSLIAEAVNSLRKAEKLKEKLSDIYSDGFDYDGFKNDFYNIAKIGE